MYYIYMCVCVYIYIYVGFNKFQSLKLSHLYLEGSRHSRFIVEAHCLPHAPSSLSPRTLQPWDPS